MNKPKGTSQLSMKESNMTDNEKYQVLMAKYKEHREEGEKANRYLKAAMKLQEKGNVDGDTFIGMAYL